MTPTPDTTARTETAGGTVTVPRGLLSDAEAKAANLGRFGHHSDAAIDFCVEVEALTGRLHSAKHAISKPGTEPETIQAVADDIARAMTFKVGGDEGAVYAKHCLRKLEDEVRAALASPQHPVAPDAYDAGLLGDYGGGDIEWWQSYIRLELARAHEFYASQWPSADDTGFWKQRLQVETRARIEAEERLSSPQHPVGVREATPTHATGAAMRKSVEATVKRIDDMFDAFLDRYATYEGNVSTDDVADYLCDVRDAVRTLASPAPKGEVTLSHPPAQDEPGAVTGDRLRSLFEEHNAELIAFAEKHGKSDFISAVWQSWQECAAALAALDPSPPLPADVRRLVIEAREVATLDNGTEKAFRELDQAAEAFASRVPWDQP